MSNGVLPIRKYIRWGVKSREIRKRTLAFKSNAVGVGKILDGALAHTALVVSHYGVQYTWSSAPP